MRVLLLASGVPSQYRVLRCAAAAGATVYVLGAAEAVGLAKSRYCAGYISSTTDFSQESSPIVCEEINECVDALGIDCVIPGDAAGTRMLSIVRDGVRASCFPVPSLRVFDTLNHKGSFAILCEKLDVPIAKSRTVTTKEVLRDLCDRREIVLPVIAKPVDMHGGVGVKKLEGPTAQESIECIDYEPILIQVFADGHDISIALYCDSGTVLAEVVYFAQAGIYHFIRNEQISKYAREIASHLRFDGVLCFDARLCPDGRSVKFVECNPRFWYNMDLALIAGINYVRLGLDKALGCRHGDLVAAGATVPQTVTTTVRTRKSILKNLPAPWRLSADDKRMLAFSLADPVGLTFPRS